ncbi:MAG TPA: class I SAM-dependent methyltransferase [Usitatibacter sp.]|nr:class I SAM-dependent methyltransferase [Usitatibacter sp.]
MKSPQAGDAIELALTPLADDPRDMGLVNGIRVWGARSRDPAFIAAPADARLELAPGWYRATAVIDNRSGDVREPRVYVPDATGGYSEARSLPMTREGRAFVADFILAHPSRQLRFDPSVTPCEFGCNGLQLARYPEPSRRAAEHPTIEASNTPATPNAAPGPPGDSLEQSAIRKRRILAMIDKAGRGVEIGPCHDPIAPKREGFAVHVIDHTSREMLARKYRPVGLPVDRIEEVDFVWSGETYLELTGAPRGYDWIIASNLIEHTPDLIAFLKDCDAILKDGGVLALAIPDKRCCFDRFRPVSGLARVVDSHVARHKMNTEGAAAEYCMNVVSRGGQLSWNPGSGGDYEFLHSASHGRHVMRTIENGVYHDLHNWVFVPHSFRVLVSDLHALGYIQMREVAFHPTEGYEFYVSLGRHGSGPPMSRLEMLEAMEAELSGAR